MTEFTWECSCENRVMTVSVTGRVNVETTGDLETDIFSKMDNINRIIMDLTRVEYISSGGLRLILKLQNEMDDLDDGLLEITGVSDSVMKIFDATGFSGFLKIIA